MQICTAEDTGRSIRVRAVCQTGWIENSRSDCVMGLMGGADLGLPPRRRADEIKFGSTTSDATAWIFRIDPT